MAAPNLAFVRTIRRSSDVVISFYPSSDPERREIVVEQACIFLLTDLFLVCSYMTPEERSAKSPSTGRISDGPNMWLLYPPLAGKHLRIADGLREGELEVTVMKREKLMIRLDNRQAAFEWKAAFAEAIAFGIDRMSFFFFLDCHFS
jgi:hypothetical protein